MEQRKPRQHSVADIVEELLEGGIPEPKLILQETTLRALEYLKLQYMKEKLLVTPSTNPAETNLAILQADAKIEVIEDIIQMSNNH